MEQKIELVLDKIRPMLDMHGGDIELVKIDKKNSAVYIRFIGTCGHCAISEITLTHLVKKEILVNCPGICHVIPVLD